MPSCCASCRLIAEMRRLVQRHPSGKNGDGFHDVADVKLINMSYDGFLSRSRQLVVVVVDDASSRSCHQRPFKCDGVDCKLDLRVLEPQASDDSDVIDVEY